MKPIKLFILIFVLLVSGTHNRLVAACNSLNSITVGFTTTVAVDLSWVHQTGVLGYQVSYSTTPTPNSNHLAFTIFPNYTITALNCGTKYYVFVRVACAANDTSTWAMDSLTTLACCYPPVPITYNPIAKTSIAVNLTAAKNVSKYEYAISTNLQPPPTNTTATNNTSITLPGLQPNTSYLVCVRTICVSVQPISFWNCDTVKTLPPCEPVTGLGKSNVVAGEYLWSWTPIANAINYEYAINTDPQPPTSGSSIQNPQVIVNGLAPKKVYTFCVRATCGTAGYKTPWTCDTLSTPPVGIEAVSLKNNNVSISPNPAHTYITVNRDNPSLHGSIRLTNLLGEVVLEQIVSGNETVVNVANVLPGFYFIWYSDKSQSSAFKVLIK